MQEEITKYLQSSGFGHIYIPDEHILSVHNLFCKDIHSDVQNDAQMAHYYGVYHQIKGNHDDVIKYYSLAINIDQGRNSMFNLASYFRTQNDYKNAMKYFLMVIEHDAPCKRINLRATIELANCYFALKDYRDAQKYYSIAVKHNNFDEHLDNSAMHNLAVCYHALKDYDNAIKYGLKVHHDSPIIINNLARIYADSHDHINALKYYSMAVEYKYVHNALESCKNVAWTDGCARYINKILNNYINDKIIDILVHHANNMDQDLVNIIINVDTAGTKYKNSFSSYFAYFFGKEVLFTKLKNMLDI